MSAERWIIVRNWDRFQHYTDREPVWIKLYTELNSSDEWCGLSLSARGLLVTLWVEYGRSRGQIKASAIPQICRQKVLRKTLESLIDAGFIEVSASKPLAFARSREKRREERDTPLPPRERGMNQRALGTNPRAVAKREAPQRKAKAWITNGLAAEVPPERLPEVIADQFAIDDPELLDDLVAYARERMR